MAASVPRGSPPERNHFRLAPLRNLWSSIQINSESNLYATLPVEDPKEGGPSKLRAIVNEFIR
jgi:hypothetical protein